MSQNPFRIGTRNSPLALRQADILSDALAQAHPDLSIEIVPMLSKADWNKKDGEKPLCEEAGGKGLFAKEIERAILKGDVDCGVHSLKDMAAFLPEGLVVNHVLPRANPFDAFISAKYSAMADLPVGAKIGSCSARRGAMVLSKCPAVSVVPFRGNVQTRLDKVKAGQVEATFLAMAGIERLGISDQIIHPLTAEDMLPACGQGVICMETRENNGRVQKILNKVHCQITGFRAFAEREVLKVLDGSCHTPIAAFAQMDNNRLKLKAEVYALDGSEVFKDVLSDECLTLNDALRIGQQVGATLKNTIPERILS